jgi:hypothetical protein
VDAGGCAFQDAKFSERIAVLDSRNVDILIVAPLWSRAFPSSTSSVS